jgi:hypothetical protein
MQIEVCTAGQMQKIANFLMKRQIFGKFHLP